MARRIAVLFRELQTLLEQEGIIEPCQHDDAASEPSDHTPTVDDGESSKLRQMAAERLAILRAKRKPPSIVGTSPSRSKARSATLRPRSKPISGTCEPRGTSLDRSREPDGR